MNETTSRKLATMTGFAALVFGAAAVTLERPWPSTSDPAAFPAFLADNRDAILAQSMLFLISAGLFMWFLGALRSFLIEAEHAPGRLSTLAFVAVLSLHTKVFPVWLGWLAVVAAAAAVLLTFALVDPTGPLAPQGWASYLLYPAPIVWLVPAATVMIRRIDRNPNARREPTRPTEEPTTPARPPTDR